VIVGETKAAPKAVPAPQVKSEPQHAKVNPAPAQEAPKAQAYRGPSPEELKKILDGQ
jgi:hypothetical protein